MKALMRTVGLAALLSSGGTAVTASASGAAADAIVALDFEEPEQQGSLERERAFVKQYGVKYT